MEDFWCLVHTKMWSGISFSHLFIINIGWDAFGPALAIMPSHKQNMHDFADGRKNINGIFNDYVCSASHMHPGRHFQNV